MLFCHCDWTRLVARGNILNDGCSATYKLALATTSENVYESGEESGTFWSQIRFAIYTQTMNPESKLSGFMNPETFESGT